MSSSRAALSSAASALELMAGCSREIIVDECATRTKAFCPALILSQSPALVGRVNVCRLFDIITASVDTEEDVAKNSGMDHSLSAPSPVPPEPSAKNQPCSKVIVTLSADQLSSTTFRKGNPICCVHDVIKELTSSPDTSDHADQRSLVVVLPY